MRAPKKAWIKPQIERIELAEAQTRIQGAVRLLENDASLENECAELRSILELIDKLKDE